MSKGIGYAVRFHRWARYGILSLTFLTLLLIAFGSGHRSGCTNDRGFEVRLVSDQLFVYWPHGSALPATRELRWYRDEYPGVPSIMLIYIGPAPEEGFTLSLSLLVAALVILAGMMWLSEKLALRWLRMRISAAGETRLG